MQKKLYTAWQIKLTAGLNDNIELMRSKILSFSIVVFGFIFSACGSPKSYWNPVTKFHNVNDASIFGFDENPKETEVLIVNVFAAGCTYCIKEIPELITFYEKYKNNPKVRFLGLGSTLDAVGGDPLSLDDIREEVKDFSNEYQLPFPVFLADTKSLGEISVTGFPETLILQKNKKGEMVLKRKFISVVTQKDLETYLN